MIERINNINDLKNLEEKDLPLLCEDLRELIIKRVEAIGGHLGSNLGIVEITVALHYVFDSPKDKFVFDTTHQTYAHKMLTGRKEYFQDPDKYRQISGFSTPAESEHDQFKCGHTSNSVSLAMGLAKGRDIVKENENIVAIIGDGALSGGQAFEALDNAGDYKKNLIIVFNDNEMSIAENHGGIYKNFEELRKSNGKSELNYFKSMGLDYDYLEEGNDVFKLIELFRKRKDVDHPVVLHIHTLKGIGYEEAIADKESYHYTSAKNAVYREVETPVTVIKKYFEELAQKDKKVIGICAGTPGVFGFYRDFRKKMGEQIVDVGICEQFEISYACGIAKMGAKPIVFVSSNFLQRAYDQLNHELAMNKMPVIVMVYGSGISGGDCTHTGLFDMGLITNIPDIRAYAPATKKELLEILDRETTNCIGPVFIRVPREFNEIEDYISDDAKIAIACVGHAIGLGKQVLDELKEKGIKVNLLKVTDYLNVDTEKLNKYELVVTIEDTLLDGGYGEKVDRALAIKNVKVMNYGGLKAFNDRVSTKDIRIKNRMESELIVSDIINFINQND